MAILIGVDEAGYGPNYGPLVVAATAWRVAEKGSGFSVQRSGRESATAAGSAAKRAVASPPTANRPPDLYKLLRRAVARSPQDNPRRLAIADSKALYKAGLGVRQLERGVLAAILACTPQPRVNGTLPANARTWLARVVELIAATAADPDGRRRELACHGDDEQSLPLECQRDELCSLAASLADAGQRNGVALVAIRARLVFPGEFNALVDRFGSKGGALSHVTLALVRRVVDELRDAGGGDAGVAGGGDAPARTHLPTAHCPPPTFIFLDKHGGRNRYAALLQHHFADSWIDPLVESRAVSRYAWTHREAPVEAAFRVDCEQLLPTALASMTAKYHRELAMRAFNAWWARHVPGLRPTCGYPGDAHRFKADIAAAQRELEIEDRVLWRCR